MEEVFVEFVYNLAEKFDIDTCTDFHSGFDFLNTEITKAGILADLDFIFRVFNLEENIQHEELELVCFYGIYSGMEVLEAFNYCCYLKEKSSFLDLCSTA